MSSEQLRTLQLFESKMLSDIADVCEKNHITYYITSGTLLGAVRHKGFIPWDDDIDISMPVEDYLRFLKIGQSLLGDKYFLQNYNTDKYYYRSYTRIIANQTTMMTRPSAVKFRSHQGVWVDIFPLIKIGDSKDIARKKKLLDICNILQRDDMITYFYTDIAAQYGKKIASITKLIHILPIQFRQKIHEFLLNKILLSDGDNLTVLWRGITKIYPKSILDGLPFRAEFEGRMYFTYPNYRLYLEKCYGDYMQLPPEEQRIGHHMYKIDLTKNYTEYTEQI